MIRTILARGLIAFFLTVTGCGNGGSDTGGSSSTGALDGSSTGGERNPVCSTGQSSGEMRRPEFFRCLAGQTSWFASPKVADPGGDGQLEIMVQPFDHGMDVFTVPDSGCDCLLWTTARSGPWRMGQPRGMD
ncbi:MAG: hypothetical protein KQI81_05485 [Deltaproteobacteria bacterium]|nr:hypothetical protein [Deltaproteobacteria bacterium]